MDDVPAWSDAVEELLGDSGARAELARAGRDRAQAFSWERCAAATVAVYDEVRRAHS